MDTNARTRRKESIYPLGWWVVVGVEEGVAVGVVETASTGPRPSTSPASSSTSPSNNEDILTGDPG